MPRPLWKGHITFGLVNVPVTLYPAEVRSDLQLHMLDGRDQSRISYERVNAETGEEVPWNQIVRGYEYSKGHYVLLDDNDLKRAAPEATKRIEIERFVKVDDIDPMFIDKPYYLEPGKGGEKGYVLLRETLHDSGLVGITRVVIRTRQYLAALVPVKQVLVVNLLRYAQEIRSTSELNIPKDAPRAYGVTEQELKIARMLVETMTDKWDPGEYHDEYRDAIMKWIDKKVEFGELTRAADPPEEADEPPATINFMELLKRSVDERGSSKPERTSSRESDSKSRESDSKGKEPELKPRSRAKSPAKGKTKSKAAGEPRKPSRRRAG